MPINTQEIIQVLSQLAEEDRLRVTVKESLKGGLIAGGVATAGGLLGGKMGLLIGGILGSIGGALVSNSFLPVTEVIASMEYDKKEALAENVRRIMAGVDITDAGVIAAAIAGDTVLRSRVVGELVDYLRTELSMAIVDH